MVIQDGGCALSDEIEACGDLEPECSVEEIRPCGGLSDSMNGTTRNFILGLSLEVMEPIYCRHRRFSWMGEGGSESAEAENQESTFLRWLRRMNRDCSRARLASSRSRTSWYGAGGGCCCFDGFDGDGEILCMKYDVGMEVGGPSDCMMESGR